MLVFITRRERYSLSLSVSMLCYIFLTKKVGLLLALFSLTHTAEKLKGGSFFYLTVAHFLKRPARHSAAAAAALIKGRER